MNQKYKTTRYQAPLKVLQASLPAAAADLATNNDYYLRPMMLNAWTQTTTEDFDYFKHEGEQSVNGADTAATRAQTEKDLRDKIRTLEENLRAHSEILSQIHATSGQKQLEPPQRSSINELIRAAMAPAPTTAVINPLPQKPTNNSFNYTIIGDGMHDVSPIEIAFSDELDGTDHLNSSAESNRLEICLQDENNDEKSASEIDAVVVATQPLDNTPSAHIIKRRKLSGISADDGEHNTSNNNNNKSSSKSDSVLTPLQTAKSIETPKGNGVSNRKSHSKTPKQNSKIDFENVLVSIGPNNTRIPASIYENMSWSTPSLATRKLLMAVFDRQTLATHSMTGKPSPAFKDYGKPLKQQLEPKAIQDIIFAVTRKCQVSEKEVRNAITTKCADENKMMKMQQNKSKKSPLQDVNKENITY